MRRRWARTVKITGLLCLLAFALYLASPPLAAWLVVSDPPQKADAIVVLGSYFIERALYAYELYRDGYAPRLVLTGQSGLKFTVNGRPLTEAFYARTFLRGLGVPDRDMVLLEGTRNTYEEARAVAAYSRQHSFRRLILVSSPYHMRRAWLALCKQLRGSGITIVNRPARQSWFQPSRISSTAWFRALNHEYLGLLYYWLRGRL